MRKLILFIAAVLISVNAIWANGVIHTRGAITEVYFEDMGYWTIEFRLDHVNLHYDSALCIYSSTDSAFLNFMPSEPGIYLINYTDLTSGFSIHKTGDSLYIIAYMYDSYDPEFVTHSRFIFGNIEHSRVNASQPGQSLVGLPDLINASNYQHPIVVKDNTPSIGYEEDPEHGTIQGYIYDSLNNTMPYMLVHLEGVLNRTCWTDENGFFQDTSAYGMNYRVYVEDDQGVALSEGMFTVEPDSVTNAELTLPLKRDIEITGRIVPENLQMIQGCYAIFTPECPFAPIDTFLTDSSGYFIANISCGIYHVRYSREDHTPAFWPHPFTFLANDDIGVQSLNEGNVVEVNRGKVSGQWNKEVPYYIFGDIIIEEQDSLIVDAGCQILFAGYFEFDIYGCLTATGLKDDTIFINCTEMVSKMERIGIYGNDASITHISYCRLNAIEEFTIGDASPTISNCLLDTVDKFSISGESAPLIEKNLFEPECEYRLCNGQSQPIFSKNIFTYRWMQLYDEACPVFEYNTFHYCGCGIRSYSDNAIPAITGNIFSVVSSPVWMNWGTDPSIITHNIFHEYDWLPSGIQGLGVLTNINANGDSCDIYFNLIDKDPLFVNPEAGNFHLLSESPCIDAGDPNYSYDPDSTIADMGAYYYDQLNTYVKKPWDIIDLYEINVIPNPNRGNFSISIESPKHHQYEASLSIYSMNGVLQEVRKVAVLDKGSNTIPFSDFLSDRSGIYVCTLEVRGKIMASTKMVINK